MNNERLYSRKFWIVVLAVIFLLVVGGAFLTDREHKRAPFYTTKIVDKDTGEVLNIQPNQIPEKNVPQYQFVFGSIVLLNDGATQAQFQKIRQAITQYSKNNLRNQYQTLTIIPKGFTSNSGVMSGQLRLGETSKIVSLKIKLKDLIYVEVIVNDPSGRNGGNYDSGQLTVDPNFYNN